MPKTAPPSAITPLKVSWVPSTLMVLLAPKVIAPVRLLVPLPVFKVPPLIVIASAPTATACKSKVAPLAITVLPAVVPKPVALVMRRVPPLMVVVPR